jgi:hypothetical protein
MLQKIAMPRKQRTANPSKSGCHEDFGAQNGSSKTPKNEGNPRIFEAWKGANWLNRIVEMSVEIIFPHRSSRSRNLSRRESWLF